MLGVVILLLFVFFSAQKYIKEAEEELSLVIGPGEPPL